MNEILNDSIKLPKLQKLLINVVKNFYNNIDSRIVPDRKNKEHILNGLPENSKGTEGALEEFVNRFLAHLSASVGGRYWGFVIGGTTPAAILGDWLVSSFDQNANLNNSIAAQVEFETLHMLRELFGISNDFNGTFVSGATMSNFVGLAIGRQWAGEWNQIDIAEDGLYKLSQLKILSASPHSSILKSLSMLGMGRGSLIYIPCEPDRECIDISFLKEELERNKGNPIIVVANAGTVNSVDFDNLSEIGKLKSEYNFWLHVDGAFGVFASCVPEFAYLINGINEADSITIDLHKWLNVPYDSAIQLTKHIKIQQKIFCNRASYLSELNDFPDLFHLTPENSRRWRALPAWFTLKSYGKSGYRDLVYQCIKNAKQFSLGIEASAYFILLAPVHLNGVCFTIKNANKNSIESFLNLLHKEGEVFLSQTIYKEQHGIRAAFCNWRTSSADIERGLISLNKTAKKFFSENNC